MKYLFVFFKNLRFRQKLFASYIFVVIIPLLTLGLYSYYQAKSFLIEQEKRNLSENVTKLAGNLDYKFNNFNSIMEYITMNPRLIEIFNTKYTDMFAEYKDVTDTIVPMINTIQGLDDNIKEIAVCTNNDFPELSGSIKSLDSVKNEFWFKFPLKYSETNWYIDSQKIIGVRRLMQQYKSQIENILYLQLDFKQTFEDITMNKISQYIILLSDQNQHIIYTQDKISNKNIHLPDQIAIENSAVDVIIDGEKFLQLRTDLPASKWVMYFLIPVDSVTVDAKRIIMATILVTGICLIMLILMVWLFSGAFFKRINNLNKKMKIVSSGNLKVDIHSDSKDEIGDLVNGVGNMLGSINALMDEVYHRKIMQKEAEIKILQSQINPHFLYNSLSFINWKALDVKAMEISLITTTLSKYYRTMLNKGKSLISVRDEIENIKAYIDIQLLMHDDCFDVKYDIDESIYEYYMLNFTLQPIVENAIEHGIDQKEDGRGKIIITAFLEEQYIKFILEDNGPGIAPEMLNNVLTQQSAGYGLKNVNERIKLVFGEQYGLSMESIPGLGTKVIVVLPAQQLISSSY